MARLPPGGPGPMLGYTKRKAMEKMDQRKKERIERQKQAMAPASDVVEQ
jgi:small Trp-rich protein